VEEYARVDNKAETIHIEENVDASDINNYKENIQSDNDNGINVNTDKSTHDIQHVNSDIYTNIQANVDTDNSRHLNKQLISISYDNIKDTDNSTQDSIDIDRRTIDTTLDSTNMNDITNESHSNNISNDGLISYSEDNSTINNIKMDTSQLSSDATIIKSYDDVKVVPIFPSPVMKNTVEEVKHKYNTRSKNKSEVSLFTNWSNVHEDDYYFSFSVMSFYVISYKENLDTKYDNTCYRAVTENIPKSYKQALSDPRWGPPARKE